MARIVNEPIIAYKYAYVNLTGFIAIAGSPYKTVDVAKCPEKHLNEPIPPFSHQNYVKDNDGSKWRHVCGFHALKNISNYNGYRSRKLATLTVELSGRVIAHQLGYRASQQRVILVEFLPLCQQLFGHDEHGNGVYCSNKVNEGLMSGPYSDIQVYCLDHMEHHSNLKFYTTEKLSKILDTKIGFNKI